MSEWVSINDKLPGPTLAMAGTEFSDDVLVVNDDGEYFVDCVVYPHGLFGGSTIPHFNQIKNVTHWMNFNKMEAEE